MHRRANGEPLLTLDHDLRKEVVRPRQLTRIELGEIGEWAEALLENAPSHRRGCPRSPIRSACVRMACTGIDPDSCDAVGEVHRRQLLRRTTEQRKEPRLLAKGNGE